MSMELDWLNARYYARIKSTRTELNGNDGMLFKRRGRTDNHVRFNIPPEWLDTWISRIVTQKSPDFGIKCELEHAAESSCVRLRQRVHEWMLGIES